MSKAILEFNLPEEQSEFDCATNGARYLVCLEGIRSLLRDYRKYKDVGPDVRVEIEKIEKQFFEITEDVW